MYDCYCKNCNNILGEWDNIFKCYDILDYCYFKRSKNIKSIYFLDCNICNKFVGIICYYVCKNCFGKDEIVEEKKLFNWFQKYKKIINHNYYTFNCEICNKKRFRFQPWFFKELTFYK